MAKAREVGVYFGGCLDNGSNGFNFSFWPVGIFKGSIYLVSMIYLLSGLFQADIKERLFRGVVTGYSLTGIAMLLAIILTNTWG